MGSLISNSLWKRSVSVSMCDVFLVWLARNFLMNLLLASLPSSLVHPTGIGVASTMSFPCTKTLCRVGGMLYQCTVDMYSLRVSWQNASNFCGWISCPDANVRRMTSRFDTSMVDTPQIAAVFSAFANAFLTTLPVFVVPNPASHLWSTTSPSSLLKASFTAAVRSVTVCLSFFFSECFNILLVANV